MWCGVNVGETVEERKRKRERERMREIVVKNETNREIDRRAHI